MKPAKYAKPAKYVPAAVGCHWTCGPFHISTIIQGARHGYCVYRDRVCIAEFITWDEVERICADVQS